MGQAAKGLAMIEQGIAKGGLKRPDDAKLRLGMAQLRAGNKARALQTLRGVGGKDGTADIARLWITQASTQG
jgi:Flp pilus assembly protein TadD